MTRSLLKNTIATFLTLFMSYAARAEFPNETIVGDKVRYSCINLKHERVKRNDDLFNLLIQFCDSTTAQVDGTDPFVVKNTVVGACYQKLSGIQASTLAIEEIGFRPASNPHKARREFGDDDRIFEVLVTVCEPNCTILTMGNGMTKASCTPTLVGTVTRDLGLRSYSRERKR